MFEQRVILVAIATTLMVGACGSDEPSTGTDAGRGAPGVDGGPVSMVDAAIPPGTDAAIPPGTDGGPSSAPDAGPGMTGRDAGGSMGMRDPRLESDPDPGEVTCGMATCMVPAQTCCTTLFPAGQTCQAPSSCSGGTSAPGNCDGPEDCSGGQLCCAPSGFSDLIMGTTCAASCGSRFQMCQTSSDCPGGQTCHACRPPMGMGNVVGLCNAGAMCPGSYTTL